MTTELAVPDSEVLEGVVAAPPKPTFAETMRALSKVVTAFGEGLRKALISLRPALHLVGHGQPAKCRICNPRGNPPPAAWTAGYRRKTRRRNRR